MPELTEGGLIELSMADVANGGVVAGQVYQTEDQYTSFDTKVLIGLTPQYLNYACKSKEIWNVPCPIFIRGWRVLLAQWRDHRIIPYIIRCLV